MIEKRSKNDAKCHKKQNIFVKIPSSKFRRIFCNVTPNLKYWKLWVSKTWSEKTQKTWKNTKKRHFCWSL